MNRRTLILPTFSEEAYQAGYKAGKHQARQAERRAKAWAAHQQTVSVLALGFGTSVSVAVAITLAALFVGSL